MNEKERAAHALIAALRDALGIDPRIEWYNYEVRAVAEAVEDLVKVVVKAAAAAQPPEPDE